MRKKNFVKRNYKLAAAAIPCSLLILLVLVCICFQPGNIHAYLEDSQEAVNQMKIGNNKIIAEENFQTPVIGKKTEKQPVAKNTGSVDCYIRGRILLSDSRVEEYLQYYHQENHGFHVKDWVLAEDGWLYYKYMLKVGETTSPVFTHIELNEALPDKFLGFTVDVVFESVQSNDFSDAREAFNAIKGGRDEISK